MKDGFLRVCAATPQISVADCSYNGEQILQCIRDAADNKAKVCVLPELCVTGYTCGDLFFQTTLLDAAKEQVLRLAKATADLDILSVLGAPLDVDGKLYNCAFILYRGEILGVVPKTYVPNHGEFFEKRYFEAGEKECRMIPVGDGNVPFGTDLLVADRNMKEFVLGVDVCEDLWAVTPPSNSHAEAGATVIVNLAASNAIAAKAVYRADLVRMQSAKLFSAYIFADAGEGESTTDLVFSGDNIIAENGTILARSQRFVNQNLYAEIDLERLVHARRKATTFSVKKEHHICYTEFQMEETPLTRPVDKYPFVPQDANLRAEQAEEVLMIQAMGLKKRLSHSGAKTAVIGVSGGLDSTLAMLVTVRAFDFLGADRKDIIAVTMPCFGTTARTKNNALELAKSLGVTLREVSIEQAVLRHFQDIGHDPDVLDVTYENAQARERTQVLMDIANQSNGLVIGTGDLSELALGWATYNGDHMSMYGVNAGVPKTLIRHLVDYEAKKTENTILAKTLQDILDTPVSPELLPPKDGEIAQKTESIVGPYALHDFFLYNVVRFGFRPAKILRLAQYAFRGEYDRDFILAWMRVFYRRFFQQQFKRSCIPDGPKVGSVALSPRGDWQMPSDASGNLWLREIEELD